MDFYNLAKDLSRKSTKKSPGKIKFRYFDDTKLEVEKYFWSARAIVEGRERLNPSRDAMVNIVSGCRSKSDVTDREQSFWMSLERLGIEKDNERGYLAEHAFNIESVDSRSYLAGEMGCDQDLAGSILSKFSRINYLRKGHSDPPVESVGAIFLSGKNLMRQASFMADFYFKRDRFVPYSTDLDFITTWLWSKLGRAFGQNHVTPIAFSVVNRTRIVLSSQLGARISDEYDRLKAEIADESVGETRKEEIARALARLKSIKVLPEDIGGDNAELAFLFEDDLVARAAEEHLSLIERVEYAKKVELDRAKEQEENKKLQEEFAALYRQSVQDKAELLRIEKVDARRARREILAPDFKGIVRLTLIVRLLYWTVPSVLSACLLFKLVSPADTPIGILGTALGALIPTFGLLSACKSKLNSVCLKIKWRGVRSWRPRRRHEPTLQEARDDTSA
ncbi:hypothetical protein [Xanthomonas arboricola]|uniref:hypothetical protein n=1 Tax=Xanthomonas arboricola TaxID=56448 RepID=UPI00118654EE|nr:hypothetical protein [Xanthomonas arboricola]